MYIKAVDYSSFFPLNITFNGVGDEKLASWLEKKKNSRNFRTLLLKEIPIWHVWASHLGQYCIIGKSYYTLLHHFLNNKNLLLWTSNSSKPSLLFFFSLIWTRLFSIKCFFVTSSQIGSVNSQDRGNWVLFVHIEVIDEMWNGLHGMWVSRGCFK